MAETAQFLRARFSKQGDVRFISHRDLLRLFERALRRARLPVAMSQGYNPRPRISLPAPLGVGFTGQNEVLDFELSQWVRPEEARRRLAAQMPEGIVLRSLQTVAAKPDRRVRRLAYRVALMAGHPLTEQLLAQLLATEQIVVHRCKDGKLKALDIAAFLLDARLVDEALLLLFGATEAGTARPEEVLDALGLKAGVHYCRSAIERTHVSLSSSL